jgi:putative ABC transport system permease protein
LTLLKQAFRRLSLRPGLSAVVITLLALGVGVTTAIFSLFHQVLVQPLPVPEPERLVNIVRTEAAPGFSPGFSYPMLRDLEAEIREWGAEQPVVTGIAAHMPFSANLAYSEGALSLLATYVSGGYFGVLGLAPALGRLIGPQDEPRAGEAAVVVLSYDLWQSRFGGDPAIVGQVLTINGQPLTVIGVAPRKFSGTYLGSRFQLFVPATMRWRLESLSSPQASPDSRGFTWLRLFARLPADVSVEQATAVVNTAFRRIVSEIEAPVREVSEEELPQFFRAPLELVPGARGQGSIPGAAQALPLLLGVTLLVLLIVCVNIANLFLVSGAARAGEMAIREAMGASRGRVVVQLFAEAALPAAIGGVLALPVAAITLQIAASILPAVIADAFAFDIGWRAAAFAAVVTAASAIPFGLLPAIRTARPNAGRTLKGHVVQAVGGRGTARLRSALATAQIAFSMVLLVLTGLFAHSLLNVTRLDLGIDVDSLVSFSVSPALNGYDDERSAAVYDGIEQLLNGQPGVIGVTSAAVPVFTGEVYEPGTLRLGVEGFDSGEEPAFGFNIVGRAFFRTLGIPLLAGRELTESDTPRSPPVAIVHERFARQYGLAGDAVGKRLRAGPDSYEIVGVVANAAYGQVKGEAPAQFFVPLNGNHSLALGWSLTFYVRAALDPDALIRAIPRVVAEVDPTLPVSNLVTLRRQVQENIFVDRLVTILSASFASLATLLVAIGLYSVMAYNVAQRTRELGLRLALGAEPASLRSMVLLEAGWITVIGIAIGLVIAIASANAAEGLLYRVSSLDPVVLVGAAALLATVVLGASD